MQEGNGPRSEALMTILPADFGFDREMFSRIQRKIQGQTERSRSRAYIASQRKAQGSAHFIHSCGTELGHASS